MRKYVGIGAAWLGATALSVLIASAAVAGIRDRVVETPVAIGAPTSTTTPTLVGETTLPGDPSTTVASSSTTSSSPATATSAAETTSTTVAAPAESTTTTATAPPTTTTTTAPPATTTTAAPPITTTAPISYTTHDLIGGTVVLAFGGGEVNLVSATPRPGFGVDAEHTGPDEVEVKFESNDHKSKLEAKIEDGELKVDTEEEPRGDEDD